MLSSISTKIFHNNVSPSGLAQETRDVAPSGLQGAHCHAQVGLHHRASPYDSDISINLKPLPALKGRHTLTQGEVLCRVIAL